MNCPIIFFEQENKIKLVPATFSFSTLLSRKTDRRKFMLEEFKIDQKYFA